jgi:hypothetical protein
MTPTAFKRSLPKPKPPAGLASALRALWWAGKNDWTRAHDIVMAHEGDPDCAWVHAHLHRVEGDLPNAGWWYKQAGKPVASRPLPAEWASITNALLSARGRD